jgi:hypothetical protein
MVSTRLQWQFKKKKKERKGKKTSVTSSVVILAMVAVNLFVAMGFL